MPRKNELRAEMLEPGHYVYRGHVIRRETYRRHTYGHGRGRNKYKDGTLVEWQINGVCRETYTLRDAKHWVDEAMKGNENA